MIDQERFLNVLRTAGVEFFTGVPDSYLNGFCNCLMKNVAAERHMIAANEGNAVGIAAGYYFSTDTVPLVYMQNSGLGNALNPLLSLVDKNVYSVPMILLIGWRGEPGSGDWPQHQTQGEVTLKILDMLGIPYVIAQDEDDSLEEQVRECVENAKREKRPAAIVGRKGVFAGGKKPNITDTEYPLYREEAIEIILDTLPENTIYTATTGRASRELYFLRERRKEGHQNDFLNVGSMGHASSVALGIAAANKKRLVVCLDGDAAAMMHMGAFTMASKTDVPNLLHIILNNGAHESVGGQPSAGYRVDFTKIAQGSGYKTVEGPVGSREALREVLRILKHGQQAALIDVRIRKGLKGELPALKISHEKLIRELMDELSKGNNR